MAPRYVLGSNAKTGASVRLTDRHRTAARALVSGLRPSAVAELVRVHPTTVSDWQRDPDFAAAVDAERAEIVTAHRGALLEAVGDAIATLREVACDRSAPASARVAAAGRILSAVLPVAAPVSLHSDPSPGPQVDDLACLRRAIGALTPRELGIPDGLIGAS